MIGSYRKYFGASRDEVMWGMSWINFIMDLATIPGGDTTNKTEDTIVVSPENEAAELRKTLGR